MRIALLVLTPLLTVLLAEGALRLCGYGDPVTFFVRTESKDGWITNPKFASQFFSRKTVLKPFLFSIPLHKSPGTIRICILGESAAMGTPDPAFSFGRILEAMLRRDYPQTHFEVMNAAMRGINSHVIRLIARECASHEVDVFLIYMGNNEVIGMHGPDPGSPPWAQSLFLIRTGQWVKSTRFGQLLSRAIRPAKDREAQDMDYFRQHRLRPDDPRRQKNRENFRENLEDIIAAASKARAKVLLATVAVNQKDFPPLESLHRKNLAAADQAQWETTYQAAIDLEGQGRFPQAITQYLAAARIDDHFAELHFRLGRCYAAVQDWVRAKESFALARDWDAMQFRTDRPLNTVIRDVGAGNRDALVTLVDVEQRFAESELSDHQIPGGKLFYEHVHPTFAGNYLLARSFRDALISALAGQLPSKPASAIPSAEECAEDIAYTGYDDVNVNAAMVRLTSGPPFLDQLDHTQKQAAAESANKARLAVFGAREAQTCLATYLSALNSRPDDWPIRLNLALFCQELKRDAQAAEQFEYLVRRFPDEKHFRLGFANSLLTTGNKGGALAQLEAALRLDPDDEDLQRQIAQLSRSGGVP